MKCLPVPFKTARADEAKAATNEAFKKICVKRISAPKYQKALKQFKREMLKQK